MQLDGLKRVSILDANIDRLALIEDQSETSKRKFSKPEEFSKDFALRLAPPHLPLNLTDT